MKVSLDRAKAWIAGLFIRGGATSENAVSGRPRSAWALKPMA